ncbi:hypothetical protein [Acinetobacter bereziniae]|uniref:hypothetical protein n=1 Tax=Acinetobacter bereziniae TaxID=106648 RepID=UPI000EF72427|nr:hypothetical protein [Acinetobacter bereziniae]
MTMKSRIQSGSTLIVVLFILIIITLIGAMAVKSGLLGLKVATNAQAIQILNQNTDAVFIPIEDKTKIESYLLGTNLFGYPKMDANRNKELIFCYKGSEKDFFSLRRASLVYIDNSSALNTTGLGINGYCQYSEGFFSSGRSATMTQISIRVGNSTITPVEPFNGIPEGTDSESAKIDEPKTLVVTVTSAMPVLSNASANDVNSCMQRASYFDPTDTKISKEGKITVSECLNNLNVPFTTQVSEYSLGQFIQKSTGST